ncbi:MAG: DUF6441 family protein [Rhodospirillales bacterium]
MGRPYFALAVQGKLKTFVDAELAAGRKAASRTMAEIAQGAKMDLREQVVNAGLGQRLANTWRAKKYPEGRDSLSSSAWIWTKAPKLMLAFNRGVVIRSGKGTFLAIPTPAAGKYGDGRKKITPGGWERAHGQRLRYVYRRTGPSLLVAENWRARTGKRGGFAKASATSLRTGRGLTSVVMFILVPQVTLKKRLDVQAVATRWAGRVPGLLAANWR